MYIYGLVFLLVGALFQITQAQCLRSVGCGCGPDLLAAPAAVTAVPGTTIIQAPSVANTLADTLSLLTVSSLLADVLPTCPCPCSCPSVVTMPAVSYCGCGYSPDWGRSWDCSCGYSPDWGRSWDCSCGYGPNWGRTWDCSCGYCPDWGRSWDCGCDYGYRKGCGCGYSVLL